MKTGPFTTRGGVCTDRRIFGAQWTNLKPSSPWCVREIIARDDQSSEYFLTRRSSSAAVYIDPRSGGTFNRINPVPRGVGTLPFFRRFSTKTGNGFPRPPTPPPPPLRRPSDSGVPGIGGQVLFKKKKKPRGGGGQTGDRTSPCITYLCKPRVGIKYNIYIYITILPKPKTKKKKTDILK